MSSDAHAGTVPQGSGLKQPYHLVDPSPWPIVGALGGFLTVLGIILAAHYSSYIVLGVGLLVVVFTMFMWWRDVIHESRTPGLHGPIVRLGLRYGVAFFIASEVMFFVGFFWAFFNFALFPENVAVTAPTVAMWPPEGIVTFNPFHFPFLNTMILLLSGTTVTWAHHGLIENKRRELLLSLGITILLGMSFTFFQYIEYSEAPFSFSGGGVYPAVFFLATGFHGFHVIVGTIFLGVCWLRAKDGQFTPQRHFGFEAAAWYWHFGDVVWLFRFVCVQVWGSGVTVAS